MCAETKKNRSFFAIFWVVCSEPIKRMQRTIFWQESFVELTEISSRAIFRRHGSFRRIKPSAKFPSWIDEYLRFFICITLLFRFFFFSSFCTWQQLRSQLDTGLGFFRHFERGQGTQFKRYFVPLIFVLKCKKIIITSRLDVPVNTTFLCGGVHLPWHLVREVIQMTWTLVLNLLLILLKYSLVCFVFLGLCISLGSNEYVILNDYLKLCKHFAFTL